MASSRIEKTFILAANVAVLRPTFNHVRLPASAWVVPKAGLEEQTSFGNAVKNGI
jgi:hypothetical protein